MGDATTSEGTKLTVGLDLGDRHIQMCVLEKPVMCLRYSRAG
jgi:hypothetical protein